MSPVLDAVIVGACRAAVIIWTLGCLFFIWMGTRYALRPRGYPWLIPLWPLMIIIETLQWLWRRHPE